tara:strand:- start:266 stop:859 length:594 start_codon:yes stop_codon:yes gene_type:complete
MKYLAIIFSLSLFSCVQDGVEYSEDYTKSDTKIEKADSSSTDLEKANYHFKFALKIAKLDRDTVGNWKEAINHLDSAIQINPKFQKAYHYKAILNSFLGNYEDAMVNINKAISLESKSTNSYFVRSGIWANKGNYNKSIEDLTTIIKLDPKNGKAYDHRGYAKINIGDKAGGCQDLFKARELGFMVINKAGDELICK